MTDTKKVAEIAEGLTKEQRLEIQHARDLFSKHDGYPFLVVNAIKGQAWPQGIAQFLTLQTDRLTPLGLAVRSHITGE